MRPLSDHINFLLEKTQDPLALVEVPTPLRTPLQLHLSTASPTRSKVTFGLSSCGHVSDGVLEQVGQADANKGHAFGILMALVDAIHSLRSFRRRLPIALSARLA